MLYIFSCLNNIRLQSMEGADASSATRTKKQQTETTRNDQ